MKEAAGFDHEQRLWRSGLEFVAGIDEVGRGAWAGPVAAAAVVFPKNFSPGFDLFDSKMLSPRKRRKLAEEIEKTAIVGYGVVEVSVIDKLGIGDASQKAFKSAVKALSVSPDFFLIDAFYIKNWAKNNQLPLKKGDQICASIAAASVVAKVFRDDLMIGIHEKYPRYGFSMNKGYGTAYHQTALKKFSFSPVHRTSFDLSDFV